MYRLFSYLLTDDSEIDVTVRCTDYGSAARKARARATKIAEKRGEWVERLITTSAVATARSVKVRGEEDDGGMLGFATDDAPDSRAA